MTENLTSRDLLTSWQSKRETTEQNAFQTLDQALSDLADNIPTFMAQTVHGQQAPERWPGTHITVAGDTKYQTWSGRKALKNIIEGLDGYQKMLDACKQHDLFIESDVRVNYPGEMVFHARIDGTGHKSYADSPKKKLKVIKGFTKREAFAEAALDM